jgi:hypothetical protein
MALEYTLKFTQRAVSQEFIISQIKKLGCQSPNITNLENGFRIDSCIGEIGFSVSLMEISKDPFHIKLELGIEFIGSQSLSLRLSNSFEYSKSQANALSFILQIVSKHQCEALLIYNDEIVLFKKGEKYVLNTHFPKWNEDFLKIFVGIDYEVVELY